MDALSVIGIIIALAAIIGGNILEGGHTGSLLQLTAFLIVIGGTLGAIMLQTPLKVFFRSLRMLPWIFIPPRIEGEETIKKIVEWSKMSRKDGLLVLETIADEETEPFSKKCLQMLVDGGEPKTIREIMETDLTQEENRGMMAAKVYESAGGYTPTIGIIGAVMGLIHVMQNLSDPSKLGEGIAVAFVATIYGVGAANLFLLPISSKLKSVVDSQTQHQEMILEGVISIAEGENPFHIEKKLRVYLS